MIVINTGIYCHYKLSFLKYFQLLNKETSINLWVNSTLSKFSQKVEIITHTHLIRRWNIVKALLSVHRGLGLIFSTGVEEQTTQNKQKPPTTLLERTLSQVLNSCHYATELCTSFTCLLVQRGKNNGIYLKRVTSAVSRSVADRKHSVYTAGHGGSSQFKYSLDYIGNSRVGGRGKGEGEREHAPLL